jgi:hypothetical protein
MFQKKVAEKVKTQILYSGNFFNCAVYEAIWKGKVQPDRLQMALSYGACVLHAE